MKLVKAARKRVHANKAVASPADRAEQYSRLTRVQAENFRMNVGMLISSERDETASAVQATHRDPSAIAKKYEGL